MAYPNTVSTLPGVFTYSYRDKFKIDGDSGGWQSQITFFTDFSNAAAFCSAIGGVVQTIGTSYGSLLRIATLQHPLFPNLFATKLSAETFGTASTTSSALIDLWSKIRVTVLFESYKYQTTGDSAYMSWDVDQGATYTTVPGRKFYFPGGEPIDQDAGAFANLNNYSLTMFNCSALDDTQIDLSAASPVNSVPFQGRPAGTMLFNGCKSAYQLSIAGVLQYQKSLSFTYRSIPWNQAFQRNGTLGIPVDPAGNPQYATSDLNLLLQ